MNTLQMLPSSLCRASISTIIARPLTVTQSAFTQIAILIFLSGLMPYPYCLSFRPSGPAWGLFPQAEPLRQPRHPLATSLVERQASCLVHIVQDLSLADSEHADLVYQDSVLSLGRRCQAVAGQACLDLSPNAALLEVLPVAESLANLVRVSGHVVLDHGLNDGAGIA